MINFFNKMSKLRRERQLLELEHLSAKASAEEMIIKADRALEDAKLKAKRLQEDTARWAKWEEQKIAIQERHAQTDNRNEIVGDYGVLNEAPGGYPG